ncbi:valine--tRNA ligase [Candidatus Pacearchaeota archaeon]|nr:MAG: valine--tRNA ligase [Candidatus Pacearchaeota archaeon]
MTYNEKEIEEKILKFWEENKIYKTKISESSFSIDTPPPTVSGRMHVGHAYSYSQQDFIARYKRMTCGVFYPFGTDDNGLPTERLVEKTKKVKSKEMSRKEFVELCFKTLKEIMPEFVYDWKRLGISADYENPYSTISYSSQKIAQLRFIELYKKGRIYHASFPTIWCPECQTSIAQAELEDQKLESKFSTIKFKVKENGSEILIATTRPELLAACGAVFINPNDTRAKELVGKTAIVPLFGQEVPIIADKSADPQKGTGILMVCSYGDKYDVAAFKKYSLPEKIIFSQDGKLTIEGYQGTPIKEARKKILEELERKGFVVKSEKIVHDVNTHDKCGTEIEFLPVGQWFIKILDKKKELIEKGKEIKWHPSYMFKRFENWVLGLEWDWNISRNRYFGIPIPVWFCDSCQKEILPGEDELPVDPTATSKECPDCGKNARGESMVLDTWATSSLSPLIASKTFDEKIQPPFDMRAQGHDIIRTWAFYTIAQSMLYDNSIPFKHIVVSGNVSLHGEKMSKSKGNYIEPSDIMERFGSDALRYWASSTRLGSDLDYHEEDLKAAKKLETKIVNASRFVFMNLGNFSPSEKPVLEEIDRWFLQKLNNTIKNATSAFEDFEYSRAKQEAETFFWKDFADNYLEIVKKRIYNESERTASARYTLYFSLLSIIKMLAPIIPFVTEHIYLEHFKKFESEKSIHLSKWPRPIEDAGDSGKFDEFCSILAKVRAKKTAAKKPMNAKIRLTLPKEDIELIKEAVQDLKDVTGAVEIIEGEFKVEFI